MILLSIIFRALLVFARGNYYGPVVRVIFAHGRGKKRPVFARILDMRRYLLGKDHYARIAVIREVNSIAWKSQGPKRAVYAQIALNPAGTGYKPLRPRSPVLGPFPATK